MQLVGPLILALLLQLLPLGWMFQGAAQARPIRPSENVCPCCPTDREAMPSRCPGPGCPVSCPVDEARPATNARERAPDEVVMNELGPMPSYPLVEPAGPIVSLGRAIDSDQIDPPDRRRATLGVWTI